MPRLIEIALFLVPLLGFVGWRLISPSPMPPPWLTYGAIGFVGLMLVGLLWAWHLDAGDGRQPYVPAELRNGVAVPGRADQPP